MTLQGNKKLVGTNGMVWISTELLAELEKIKAEVKAKYESFSQCGDPAEHQTYAGWTGDGSMTLIKENSRGIKMLAEAFQTGIMPDIKIITKLTNPATGKSERVCIEGITFEGFDLANFESKGLVKEELAFKFSKYTILETM